MSMRSHTCGQVTDLLIGQEITLAGWVNRRRDHGGVRQVSAHLAHHGGDPRWARAARLGRAERHVTGIVDDHVQPAAFGDDPMAAECRSG